MKELPHITFSEAVRAEIALQEEETPHCRKAALLAMAGDFTSAVIGYKMERRCCKRAFLRHAFLKTGTMSDPEKAYHLEFACEEALYADMVQAFLNDFGIRSGRTLRKGRAIVYLKDGEDVAELLNVMGAHRQMMELENLRIYKEMRGRVNRRVNCDAANIRKTVGAAAEQIEAIRFLEAAGQLRRLPSPLYKAAQARLKYPEATLAELAERMDPPVGKSGMNHRLQKILALYREYAEKRESEE
ncbi:MAG: DNA-binding protein WhiA [Lachnospiraceae bacterium]|nr:DNA-binding protein WhiA [Lachnospiraceae bacterium]